MKKNTEAATKKTSEKKETKLEFQLRNDTKGAFRFEELNKDGDPIEKVDDEGGAIGSLYVRKSFMSKIMKGDPEGCTVIITFR